MLQLDCRFLRRPLKRNRWSLNTIFDEKIMIFKEKRALTDFIEARDDKGVRELLPRIPILIPLITNNLLKQLL